MFFFCLVVIIACFFLCFFQVCRPFLLCFSLEKGLHFLSSVFQSRQLKSDFSISVLWFRFFVPFYPRSIFNIQHSMHQCLSSSTLDVCFTEVLNSFLLIFSRYRLSTGLEWLKKSLNQWWIVSFWDRWCSVLEKMEYKLTCGHPHNRTDRATEMFTNLADSHRGECVDGRCLYRLFL